jgi:hypothetical protein
VPSPADPNLRDEAHPHRNRIPPAQCAIKNTRCG